MSTSNARDSVQRACHFLSSSCGLYSVMTRLLTADWRLETDDCGLLYCSCQCPFRARTAASADARPRLDATVGTGHFGPSAAPESTCTTDSSDASSAFRS